MDVGSISRYGLVDCAWFKFSFSDEFYRYTFSHSEWSANNSNIEIDNIPFYMMSFCGYGE